MLLAFSLFSARFLTLSFFAFFSCFAFFSDNQGPVPIERKTSRKKQDEEDEEDEAEDEDEGLSLSRQLSKNSDSDENKASSNNSSNAMIKKATNKSSMKELTSRRQEVRVRTLFSLFCSSCLLLFVLF
jgi:hypothetical protein